MINITKTDKNLVEYFCDCGTRGRCIIRPVEENADILMVPIKCFFCGTDTMAKLEINKKNITDPIISFALAFTNDIIKKEDKDV